jgi:hypothetical protein
MADGLGHGPEAAKATQTAVRLFLAVPLTTPADMLGPVHEGLRSTRGAAVSLALVQPAAGAVVFSGIGNVAGILVSGGVSRRMVAHNGTAGMAAPRLRDFVYSSAGAPILIIHSDGISSSWSLDSHPGLLERDPTLIAAVLYRDHARGRDDATVLIWKSGA